MQVWRLICVRLGRGAVIRKNLVPPSHAHAQNEHNQTAVSFSVGCPLVPFSCVSVCEGFSTALPGTAAESPHYDQMVKKDKSKRLSQKHTHTHTHHQVTRSVLKTLALHPDQMLQAILHAYRGRHHLSSWTHMHSCNFVKDKIIKYKIFIDINVLLESFLFHEGSKRRQLSLSLELSCLCSTSGTTKPLTAENLP